MGKRQNWQMGSKKVYPKEDINALNAKLRELRDLSSQELWELVDVTD